MLYDKVYDILNEAALLNDLNVWVIQMCCD